ncbi:Uncharacterised protein [Helicobacter pametensis]|nr:Uncharacterised protein [Helicobacter pametensis]
MPMITSIKFDNVIFPTIGSSQANSTHCGLCSTAHKTHLFHSLIKSDNLFSQGCLKFCGSPKAHSLINRSFGNLSDFRICMSKNQWPPTLHKIKIFVPIYIINIASLSSCNKPRRPSHATKSSHWRIHSPYNHLLGFIEIIDTMQKLHTYSFYLICFKYRFSKRKIFVQEEAIFSSCVASTSPAP